MHRGGWKLLLPTLLPHEGGAGPGAPLLLLTEQPELLFADSVDAINGGGSRQILDLSLKYSNCSAAI